jgi:regulator of replication initiation timing
MSKTDKSTPNYGLLKVPDIVLLKQANIEIGKLQSYIQELEDKLKLYDFDEKKKTMSQLIDSNNGLKIENKKLRKENSELMENLLKERNQNNG